MADRTPFPGGPVLDPGAFEAALSYRELLGRRLELNARIRFVVGSALVVGPWVGVLLGALEVWGARLLSAAGAVLVLTNIYTFVQASRHLDPEVSSREHEKLRRLVTIAVAGDYVVLALSVALLGGVRSPVTAFYLLHVVVGNITLLRDAAIRISVLAYVLICAQAYAEMAGWAPGPALRSPAFTAPLDDASAFAIAAVYGVLFLLVDGLMISIMERLRSSEMALLQQNRRLDQLSRMRREFLRVAIHNLRSPVGASQMLLESLVAGMAGSLNRQQEEWLLRIGRRLEGLQEMLQDLQVLGQLETEDVERKAEVLDLGEVVRDVVEDYAEQARSVGIELVALDGEGVPKVRGIRRLLREAVANYVTNAIKYAPNSGKVVLETQALIADRGPWARVEVRDRGPGVPAEKIPLLFHEFTRAIHREARADHPASSGLGLAITRRIVETHGGRVGVETQPGEGSAFWIELPSADQVSAGGT